MGRGVEPPAVNIVGDAAPLGGNALCHRFGRVGEVGGGHLELVKRDAPQIGHAQVYELGTVELAGARDVGGAAAAIGEATRRRERDVDGQQRRVVGTETTSSSERGAFAACARAFMARAARFAQLRWWTKGSKVVQESSEFHSPASAHQRAWISSGVSVSAAKRKSFSASWKVMRPSPSGS